MSRRTDGISGRSLVVVVTMMLAAASIVTLATWVFVNVEIDTIVETSRSYDESAATKAAIIGQMRDIIELRMIESDIDAITSDRDDESLLNARSTLEQMWATLDAYRNLGVNDGEVMALAGIAGIIDNYARAYGEAEGASSGLGGVDDINTNSVDTESALDAVMRLDHARFAQHSLNNAMVTTLMGFIKIAMAVLAAIILVLVAVCYRFAKSWEHRLAAIAALRIGSPELGARRQRSGRGAYCRTTTATSSAMGHRPRGHQEVARGGTAHYIS